jgi:hypothetical protein
MDNEEFCSLVKLLEKVRPETASHFALTPSQARYLAMRFGKLGLAVRMSLLQTSFDADLQKIGSKEPLTSSPPRTIALHVTSSRPSNS